MKTYKLFIFFTLVMVILSVGCASAVEDANSTDVVSGQSPDIENACSDDLLSACRIDLNDNDVFIISNENENYFDITDEDSQDGDVNGQVSIKIDGKPATLKYVDDEDYFMIYNDGKGSSVKVDEDREASFCIDKLKPGTYHFQVELKSNSGTRIDYRDVNIIIRSADTVDDVEIDVEEVYIQANRNNLINIIAPSNVISSLNVKINSEGYSIVKTSPTSGYVNISKLENGSYEITVQAAGLTLKESFRVIHAIRVPEEITCGENEFISLSLPKNATGNLIITKDDDEVFSQKLTDGFAEYSLKNLGVGSYRFKVRYDGDDYNIEEYDEELLVLPIITCPSVMTAGENKFITFDFGADTRGQITIEADGEAYAKVDLSGGKAEVSLANLDDGNVDLDVSYFGEDGFSFEKSFEIKVLEVKPRIVGAKDIKMTYHDRTFYRVVVYATNAKLAEENEHFEITIGKKYYSTKVGKNGEVNFKINVAPGKYKIRASYDGVSVESVLVVKHLLKLKKVKVKKSANLILKASVKKSLKGKKIIFKFNGKRYAGKISKNGVAKVKVKKSVLLKLKKSKVTYSAAYLKDSVKRTVKVRK